MSIKALPSMEHTFTLDVKGSDTGQPFQGTFTYKRPNLRTKSEIDKTTAILNGGIMGLDEDTQFFHKMLATLKHSLVEMPEWYEKADYGFELRDENVIIDLYRETVKFEKEWRDKVWGEEEVEEKKEEKEES